MTRERACIRDRRVGNRRCSVRSHDIGVKIQHALAAQSPGLRSHSMWAVAHGARDSEGQMCVMPTFVIAIALEGSVRYQVIQIVTFST